MITLLVLGLMFLGLLVLPLVLLKVVLGLSIAIVTIPLRIVAAFLGGVTRGLFKGMFWLALLLVSLAIITFPFTILAFGGWLLYRLVRPRRRPPQAYVVA